MRITRIRTVGYVAVACLGLLQALLAGQAPNRFDARLLDHFTYRNLGPFRAGAWISDIAVPESPQKAHLYTFYVAARHGGVWKTTNNGTTFTPVFDDQGVSSIGSIALAPSNSNIVWVGTGEASNARSAYPGDGVYKSIDGGSTWQRTGLDDTHHIARIVVHPTNPDVVYVAAMGHLFSANDERGVFRTTDGGRTWKKVLFVSDKVGAIELVLNRHNPKVLFAATYEFERHPWQIIEGGPGSGIYRTGDGGTTWTRLAGGLPSGKIGRIGLDLYQRNPDILCAIVENNNLRPPTEDERKRDQQRKVESRDRPIGGEVYRTEDGGRTWRKMNAATDPVGAKAAYSFDQLRIDPNNDKRLLVNSDSLIASEDAGRTWNGVNWNARNLFKSAFGDFRTIWIDPQNSDRIIVGSDGGVHISYDGGKTCDHYMNLPLGEVYGVAVDMDTPYNIYAGLQDHETWKGPSDGWSGAVGIEDWVTTGTGDGMYNVVDPTDSRWLYTTSEMGQHARVDQRLHTRTPIAPRRGAGQPPLRFNWTAPIRLSPHNSQILYAGAQVLLRSLDRGDHWQEISPDLTTNDASKINPPGSVVPHCTITTISESPVTAGVIWVGTDDGKVQLTRDHGATWADLTSKLTSAGAPQSFWVTRVLASTFAPGTAYVTKSGHRADDFRAVIFKTADFGATWTSVTGDLPKRPVNVIVEDREQRNLLFAGTDGGVFVTIDGGRRWVRMRANMPASVPVHDLVIQPREGDLVVGTYGRGIWVTNIAPLREMVAGALDKDVYLFSVRPRARAGDGAWGNYDLSGDRNLVTSNEPNGLVFEYYLREKAAAKVTLTISTVGGAVVRTLEGPAEAGMNRVVWNLSVARGASASPPEARGVAAEPGDYLLALDAAGQHLTRTIRVLAR